MFVDSVKELVPSLNWMQVIFDLDHPGFLIKASDAVRLIILAYLRATNEVFPVEAIYKAWNNTYGQVTYACINIYFSTNSFFSTALNFQ